MEVGIGVIGLGNVGTGTLDILSQNAKSIREKLGFRFALPPSAAAALNQSNCRLCLSLFCAPRIGAS